MEYIYITKLIHEFLCLFNKYKSFSQIFLGYISTLLRKQPDDVRLVESAY